jgi:hypothetical protein
MKARRSNILRIGSIVSRRILHAARCSCKKKKRVSKVSALGYFLYKVPERRTFQKFCLMHTQGILCVQLLIKGPDQKKKGKRFVLVAGAHLVRHMGYWTLRTLTEPN